MSTLTFGLVEHGREDRIVGDSFKMTVPVYDGVVTATAPFGALRSVASATIKGVLTIYRPDGATNVTRDTSVSGEGEKDDYDGDGTNDAFNFYIAGSVTTGWTPGLIVPWQVQYQDSSPTPTDAVIVAKGAFYLRAAPSAGGS